MPNAFTEIQPVRQPIDTFVPLPLELMMKAGAMKQENQDKHDTDIAKIEALSADVMPGDKPIAKKYLDDLHNELETKWANANWDDPNVNREWNKRRIQIANDFSPNGNIGYMENEKKQAEEQRKVYESHSKEMGQPLDKAMALFYNQYNNFSSVDNNGNFTNHFQTNFLPKHIDEEKRIAELSDKIAYDEAKSDPEFLGFINGDPYHYRTRTKGDQWIDRNKVTSTLIPKIMADTELQRSLLQDEQFGFGDSGLSNKDNPFYYVNPNDKQIYGNMNTRLGKALEGRVSELTFNRYTPTFDVVNDENALNALHKKDIPTYETGTMRGGNINNNNISLYGAKNPVSLLLPGTSFSGSIFPGLSILNGNWKLNYDELDGKPGNWSKFMDYLGASGVPLTFYSPNHTSSGKEIIDESKLKDQLVNLGYINKWITKDLYNNLEKQSLTYKTKKEQDDFMEYAKKGLLEKVVKNLVKLSVSSSEIYQPPTSIDDNAVIKTLTPSISKNKDLSTNMQDFLNSNDRKNNSDKDYSKIGFDFSSSKPQIEITAPNGQTDLFEINNHSMESKLQPINNVVYKNKQVQLGNENPSLEDGIKLDQILHNYIKYNPGINSNNFRGLSRIQDDNGEWINSFADVNDPGKVYIIVSRENGDIKNRGFNTMIDQSKFVQNKADQLFNSDEFHSVLGKKENKQQVGR